MSESVRIRHKGVLIIIDGLGDLPVASLHGKTPLEAADTPSMDYLASKGRIGLVDPISPGVVPGTHSGTGLLMGLAPDQVDLFQCLAVRCSIPPPACEVVPGPLGVEERA